MGRDIVNYRYAVKFKNFNSRARMGRDMRGVLVYRDYTDFNSRARMGRDFANHFFILAFS